MSEEMTEGADVEATAATPEATDAPAAEPATWLKGIEDDIDQEASNSKGASSRELTQDTTDSARSAMYDRANEEPAKDH